MPYFLNNVSINKTKVLPQAQKILADFDYPLQDLWFYCSQIFNRIGGVMVSVFASSAIDRGFDPRSGQIKDFKIGICCFSAKQAALRRKNKDWLARNQNNVSEWTVVSVSQHYKNPTQRVGLELRGPHHHHFIEN